jgi:hypothetical protein
MPSGALRPKGDGMLAAIGSERSDNDSTTARKEIQMTEINMTALETVTGGTAPMAKGTRPARYISKNQELSVDILKGGKALVKQFRGADQKVIQLHAEPKGMHESSYF